MENRYWHRRDVRASVCLSVRTPPSKTSSNRSILKIIFLLERYDIRDLSFVLFVCPCVRMDRHNRPVTNSVLTVRFSKFFFCLKGMTPDTDNLCTVSVCLYGRTEGQTKSASYKFRSNSPIFKIRFLFEKYDTRYPYFIHCVCLYDFPSIFL